MVGEAARRPARIALLALAAACALLASQARPADAVQVRPGSYWDVIDVPGVDNNVVISQVAPDRIRVTDSAGVTFLGDCVAESPQAAVCPIQLPLLGGSFFEMGAGNDSLTVTSFPFIATAFGGLGDDTLTAPVPAPVPTLPESSLSIVALEGGPGNDVMIGSEGEDAMKGGQGDDLCLGGGGPDNCRLALGDDRCDAGAGNDKCLGAKGRDACLMGSGKDLCNGGKGRDSCDGGRGGDDTARDCERTRRFEELTR